MAQTNCVQNQNNLSNTVTTQINHAQIDNGGGGLVKYVNTNFTDIGQTLTYTIVMKNTGNTPANNVVLQDTIPNNTTFVPNTVTLNGITQPGANPGSGIGIGVLNPNQTSTVTFQVLVGTNPNPVPNPLPNSSNITYQYTSDPSNPNGASGANPSNTVNTQVNHGQINPGDGGFVKKVNRAYADVGDTLIYTLTLKNTGSTTVNNVNLTDTIPNATSFVNGSLNINGTATAGNPQNGVVIGDVGPGNVVTVTFAVIVTTIPAVQPIPNRALLGYSYIVNPSIPTVVTTQNFSNTVNTQINNANIPSPNKTVSPAYADIGTTITYTVFLQNTGNVTATNVTFTDTIPSGTTLVNNSVTLNNTVIPGANPANGVNIGNLNPGAAATLTFKVLAVSIPTQNPIMNVGQINYNYTTDPSNPNGNSNSTPTKPSYNNINHGELSTINNGIQKTVVPAYAAIGETISYTLKLRNTGNVTVNNVVIYDTIPNGTALVPGSIAVNNVSQATGNLQTGLPVGSIAPNQTTTVTFRTVVTTIPNPNPIVNTFDTSYNYIVDPSSPPVPARNTSNGASTQVNDPGFGRGPNSFVKIPSKAYADVGDTITYTVVLNNTGNVAANNVVVRDTLPNGTAFIPNSVFVNGVQLSGQDPQTGIGIGTVNPGQVVTTTFSIKVTSIPNPNPIANTAGISYNYTKDPSVPNGENVNGGSNTSFTQVNSGSIPAGGFVKSADKNYVKRGDVVTYTFVVPNTGNVTVSNVIIYDTIPNVSSFVAQSVMVNSVSVPTANPGTGIPVGTIPPGGISTVTYKVLVTTVPTNGLMTNQGIVNYSYIVDPSLPPKNGSTSSNQNNVNVRDASINAADGGFVKTATPQYVQLGDTVTYTLRVNNTGNVSANNVVIYDTIPDGAQFVQNSVTINGVISQNTNPQTGINIGTAAPNTPITVTFKVVVTSVPASKQLANQASASYNFVMDPTKPPVNGNGSSNPVTTPVNSVNFNGDNFKKTNTPPNYVAIGDTITYTFFIRNAGNIDALNTTFIDTIPQGVTFVPNSVVLNGSTLTGANPQTGINLQTVEAGEVDTITFQVVVNTIPKVNPIPDKGILTYSSQVNPTGTPVLGTSNTNTVYNQVNSAYLNMLKVSEPSSAVVGDTVTYTIYLGNSGNMTAQNTVIKDTLPPELQFVTGSVKVNGKPEPTKNIVNGFSLGDIGPGQLASVSFNAVVLTVPSSGAINNQASSQYEYIVDPSLPPRPGSNESNKYPLVTADAHLDIKKVADKKEVVLGETITYTVTITNDGTITVNNIIVSDHLQVGTSFVPNSFTLNGKQINGLDIEDGFNIGSLAPGQTAVLKYQVRVDRVCGCCTIINEVMATFNYQVTPQSANKNKTIGPVSTTVMATSPAFKQFNVDAILVVPCPKPDVEEVSNLSVVAIVKDYHIIETIRGTSAENQHLTGYKLVINGVIKADLEYVSDACKSMNMATFERKFSTYIVLSEDVDPAANVTVQTEIEDVYFKRINCREVFTNVTLMVKAQVSC